MKQVRIQRRSAKSRVRWDDEQSHHTHVDADTSAAADLVRRIDDLLDDAG